MQTIWLKSGSTNYQFMVRDEIEVSAMPELAPVIADTALEKRQSSLGVSSYEFSFDRGFGIAKLDPNNPDHIGRFYDSECETRFPGQVTPPLLVNTATFEEEIAADTQEMQVLANFGGNLYAFGSYYDASQAGGADDEEVWCWIWDPDHATTKWDKKSVVMSTAECNGGKCYARDAVVHGIYFFIACDNYDSAGATWYLKHSTDASTWTAAVGSLPAHAASDTFGQLLSFGNMLIVTIWDNSAGQVLVYSTTDLGVTWVSECSVISSGASIGLVSWVNQDGDDVPWMRLREGWGWVDLANNVFVPIVDVPAEASTAKGMEVWGGLLHIPEQEGQNRCYYSDGALIVQSVGLNKDDGLIAEKQGHATCMARSNRWLLVAYGGLAASKKACVFAWNGEGWHFIAKHATANQRIIAMAVSSADDDLTRLHYTVLTGTNQTTAYYLDYILDNSKQNSSVKFETGKTIVAPQFGGYKPEINGAVFRLDMDADDLTAANETIGVKYGINGAAYTTALGTFTSADYDLVFTTTNAGDGIVFKRIQPEFTLNRAAATNTNRPIMYNPVLYYRKKMARRFSYGMAIDIDATMQGQGELRSREQIITDIETLMDTQTLCQFWFWKVTAAQPVRIVEIKDFGAVERVVSHFDSYISSERSGLMGIRVEEIL